MGEADTPADLTALFLILARMCGERWHESAIASNTPVR
jgi:hypothetical protein